MKIWKIVNFGQSYIRHGSVLRIHGKWPYEDLVDFLLVYLPGNERENVLVVATGHKAGLVAIMLPDDSSGISKGNGISTAWAIKNWNCWIYPECSIDDVYIIDRYDPPQALDGFVSPTT